MLSEVTDVQNAIGDYNKILFINACCYGIVKKKKSFILKSFIFSHLYFTCCALNSKEN